MTVSYLPISQKWHKKGHGTGIDIRKVENILNLKEKGRKREKRKLILTNICFKKTANQVIIKYQ